MIIFPMYIISDHYWFVGDDADNVWSSARAGYVSVDDAAYTAWVEAGGITTRIPSEDELREVFEASSYPDGWYGGRVRWSSLDWIGRLTMAEQMSIVSSARSEPAIALVLNTLSSAGTINSYDPRTVAGVDVLVGAGLLTKARGDELLAPVK